MVSHRRRRTFLTVLGLYVFAALFIGYFGMHSCQRFTPPRVVVMKSELNGLKAERAHWERRVSLLRADRIDPDMLDERARALVAYLGQRDLTLLLNPR